MNTFECIKTRRSIHAFTEKNISKKIIRKIIEAGMHAPSSKNSQPWHFIILKGKRKDKLLDVLEAVLKKKQEPKWIPKGTKILSKSEIYAKKEESEWVINDRTTYFSSYDVIKRASVFILVFNKAPFSGGFMKVLKNCTYDNLTGYVAEVASISCAVENILLAAHDAGLGGIWIRDIFLAIDEIKRYAKCKYDFFTGIALGYSKHKLLPRKISRFSLNVLE